MGIIPFTTYLEVFIGELKVYVYQYTTDKSFKQNIKNVEFQWWQIQKRFQVKPLSSLQINKQKDCRLVYVIFT